MKRTSEPYNVNTRTYWNGIYGDDAKKKEYLLASYNQMYFRSDKNAMVDMTQRFKTAVKEVKDGDRALDMACGVGNFANMVKETYPDCEVWGTDISDAVIKANQKEYPNIKYLAKTVGEILEKDYFDVIFCGEIIEHLDDPASLFKSAFQQLKKGGKLITTTPRGEHIHSMEHVWYFEKEDVEKLYTDNGFKDVRFPELPDTEHIYVIFGIGAKA
jgi:2-polyprenyl-3-methyl-5-hydroxy-6-metoxy-1,4-benzoquinol methylase